MRQYCEFTNCREVSCGTHNHMSLCDKHLAIVSGGPPTLPEGPLSGQHHHSPLDGPELAPNEILLSDITPSEFRQPQWATGNSWTWTLAGGLKRDGGDR